MLHKPLKKYVQSNHDMYQVYLDVQKVLLKYEIMEFKLNCVCWPYSRRQVQIVREPMASSDLQLDSINARPGSIVTETGRRAARAAYEAACTKLAP